MQNISLQISTCSVYPIARFAQSLSSSERKNSKNPLGHFDRRKTALHLHYSCKQSHKRIVDEIDIPLRPHSLSITHTPTLLISRRRSPTPLRSYLHLHNLPINNTTKRAPSTVKLIVKLGSQSSPEAWAHPSPQTFE